MASKDTIDILNRKEFFYYDKPPKTPEIEKQDREQTKRDFALIRKDLEVLKILKPMLEIKKGNTWWYLDIKHCFFDTQEHIDLIKEWLYDK